MGGVVYFRTIYKPKIVLTAVPLKNSELGLTMTTDFWTLRPNNLFFALLVQTFVFNSWNLAIFMLFYNVHNYKTWAMSH